MRWTALLVVLVASCDRGKPAPSQGSALPAPQMELMQTVVHGMFEKPTAAATPPDAASSSLDAPDPPYLSSRGFSTLGRIEWSKQDDATTTAFIQQHIGLADTTVKLVKGNWSVRRGDQELVRVVREEGGAPEGPRPAGVIVFTSEVLTVEGLKVGDKVGTVISKSAELVCIQDLDHSMTLVRSAGSDLMCIDRGGGPLGVPLQFVVKRPQKLPTFRSPDDTPSRRYFEASELADLDIIAIAHEFD